MWHVGETPVKLNSFDVIIAMYEALTRGLDTTIVTHALRKFSPKP